jgi:hypothetical protein
MQRLTDRSLTLAIWTICRLARSIDIILFIVIFLQVSTT